MAGSTIRRRCFIINQPSLDPKTCGVSCPLWFGLPVDQIGERQHGASRVVIEPATVIIERDPRRWRRLEAGPGMGPFVGESQHVQELVMDVFDDLAPARNGAAQLVARDAPNVGKGYRAWAD